MSDAESFPAAEALCADCLLREFCLPNELAPWFRECAIIAGKLPQPASGEVHNALMAAHAQLEQAHQWQEAHPEAVLALQTCLGKTCLTE